MASMSANRDVIVFFPIYGQFAAIRKPDYGGISIKLLFSLIVTIILQNLKKELKNF